MSFQEFSIYHTHLEIYALSRQKKEKRNSLTYEMKIYVNVYFIKFKRSKCIIDFLLVLF